MAIAVYEGEAKPKGDFVLVHSREDCDWYAECGDMYRGETVLCPKHLAQAEREYPQGWRAYPGDVCRHGVYVGGCGADLMCGRCEMGDE